MKIWSNLRLAVLILPLAITGCSSLLGPSGEPARLYVLHAPKDVASGPRLTTQLLVDLPVSALDLNTTRIAVSQQAGAIEYYADVLWRDRPPLLLQGMLVEAFENSGRIPAVARSASGLRSDYLLNIELRDFQAERDGTRTRAHIRFAVRLVRAGDRSIVATENFDSVNDAASEQFEDVIAAFNRAAADSVRRAVTWTLAQPVAARADGREPQVQPPRPGPRR